DAMADAGDVSEIDAPLEPFEQRGDGAGVIRRRDGMPLGAVDGEEGVGEADALDPSGDRPPGRIAGLEESQLDARRTAVDRQYGSAHDRSASPRSCQVLRSAPVP